MASMDRYADNASEDKNQISKEFVIQILENIELRKSITIPQHDSTNEEKKIKKMSNI